MSFPLEICGSMLKPRKTNQMKTKSEMVMGNVTRKAFYSKGTAEVVSRTSKFGYSMLHRPTFILIQTLTTSPLFLSYTHIHTRKHLHEKHVRSSNLLFDARPPKVKSICRKSELSDRVWLRLFFRISSFRRFFFVACFQCCRDPGCSQVNFMYL